MGTSAITINRGKSSQEPTHAQCADCLRRGRRGGQVTFKGADSAGVFAWEKRHANHGTRR